MTCLCLSLPLLGCGDDRGSSDQAETSTGDGDGDPTGDGDGDPTGDGDGDPTGDGDGDPSAECSDADQCVLVNDCCTCDVVPLGQEPPCDVPECFAPVCDANGYTPSPACLVGTCTAAPLSCDPSRITGEIEPPPPCADGLVRSVDNTCYGTCVPPSMCEGLPFECDAGTCGDGFACMTTQSGAPSRCIPLPPGCGGSPSCDCVASWLDEVCGGGCSDDGATLLCTDGG
jgi:hypothetical protein